MILVCPNCAARYILSSSALGEGGRNVSCAKCAHKWYQEPEVPMAPKAEENPAPIEEKVQESVREPVDARLDEDPIPEGVKPKPRAREKKAKASVTKAKKVEKTSFIAKIKNILFPSVGRVARLTGYGTAVAVFVLLVVAAVMFKPQVVSAWLPSAAIYEMAGMPVTFEGEGLVMESLSAKMQKDVDGQDFLLLEGRVINLTNQVQPVPGLLARLRSTNGEDGDQWKIETPLQELEPGESFTFRSDYDNAPRGVGSVNLSFIPSVVF